VIDLGISKMALIGAVALIVIGPEKLPRVARTVGALLGKAQRYVSDVKAEVSRSMELDELKKMKDSVAGAAKDMENTIQSGATDFEKSWADATNMSAGTSAADSPPALESYPVYRHPGKHWRVKQGATPNWYKARSGTRTRALSGAARVARFRPQKAG
jgi:sec-independent protein translocase protein TatB